jgi:copper chaperone CopZ
MKKISILIVTTLVLSIPAMAENTMDHNGHDHGPDHVHTHAMGQAEIGDNSFDTAPDGEWVKVDALGLVCDFCARALEKVFSKQDSVHDIHVNLTAKRIDIALKPDAQMPNDKIRQLIRDSGYNIDAIHRHVGKSDNNNGS